jgi:hypothetical protein
MAAHRVWDAGVGGSSPPTPTVPYITLNWGEGAVRGRPVDIARRKADMIVIAARYPPGAHQVELVQAHRRMGEVWGDRQLITRQQVIEALRAGQRVYTGRLLEALADYELHAPLRLEQRDGASYLVVQGQSGEGDLLGVPVF